MASLKDFKKRINSISSTQKLTRAMQLVAANKLSKAQDVYEENQQVITLAQQIITKVLTIRPFLLDSDHLKHTNHQIAILITSDKGLCGGYNSSVIKNFKAHILRLEEEDAKLIVIGKIGQKHFQDFPKIETYPNVFEEYSYLAETITEKIIDILFSYLHCSVIIYFNDFKNFVTYNYKEQTCWPIEIKQDLNPIALDKISYKDVLRIYFKTSIINALLSSANSELSARMIAMDNASKNADTLIDKLTLQFNRTRQELITKELIEIISGAEAL